MTYFSYSSVMMVVGVFTSAMFLISIFCEVKHYSVSEFLFRSLLYPNIEPNDAVFHLQEICPELTIFVLNKFSTVFQNKELKVSDTLIRLMLIKLPI